MSSDSWLRACEEVNRNLPGLYKLVNDLLIGAKNYKKLAERLRGLTLPTCLKELRGWLGMCKQLNHCVPNFAVEPVTLRKWLKKREPFFVTKEMHKEFKGAIMAIGKNILLNFFNVKRTSLVITNGCGDCFGHILLQASWRRRGWLPHHPGGVGSLEGAVEKLLRNRTRGYMCGVDPGLHGLLPKGVKTL